MTARRNRDRSRVASFSSLLGLHKDIYILSNADKQNQRGARWPLPHHYQTHITSYIHRERSGQIEPERSRVAPSSSLLDFHKERYTHRERCITTNGTTEEQGGQPLNITRLTQRHIHIKLYIQAELKKSEVATPSSLLDSHNKLYTQRERSGQIKLERSRVANFSKLQGLHKDIYR